MDVFQAESHVAQQQPNIRSQALQICAHNGSWFNTGAISHGQNHNSIFLVERDSWLPIEVEDIIHAHQLLKVGANPITICQSKGDGPVQLESLVARGVRKLDTPDFI